MNENSILPDDGVLEPVPVQYITPELNAQALAEVHGFKSIVDLVAHYELLKKFPLAVAPAAPAPVANDEQLAAARQRINGLEFALEQRVMHQRTTTELRDHWAMLIYGKGGYDFDHCYREADKAIAARLRPAKKPD